MSLEESMQGLGQAIGLLAQMIHTQSVQVEAMTAALKELDGTVKASTGLDILGPAAILKADPVGVSQPAPVPSAPVISPAPVAQAMPPVPFPNTPTPAPAAAAPVFQPQAAPVFTPPAAAAPAPVFAPPAAALPARPFNDPKGAVDYVIAKFTALGPVKGQQIQGVIAGLGIANINNIRPDQYDGLYAGVEAIQ